MLTKEEAAARRRACIDPLNGLEVWHRLLAEYQPKVRNRFGGVLQDLLNFGSLEDTIDASSETDHAIYSTLQKLLKLGYLEVEEEEED